MNSNDRCMQEMILGLKNQERMMFHWLQTTSYTVKSGLSSHQHLWTSHSSIPGNGGAGVTVYLEPLGSLTPRITCLGGGQDTQAMVSSPPPFSADYLTSKTGSWAIFNKVCQNDLTRYCHNGIINLLFSKFKKLKLGGGQDAQATVSSSPRVIIRAGVKIPQEILTPGGQAAHGYLDPQGSSCPGVKINRYTWFRS